MKYKICTFVSMYVGYMAYMFARRSLTYALPELLSIKLADRNTLGLVTSCLSLCYAGSKLISGVLADHMKPTTLFTVGLTLSALTNIIFPMTTSVIVWCCIWGLNGLVQGVAWPACGKLLKNWMRPSEFGTFWSILSTSLNVAGGTGAIIVPFLVMKIGWNHCMVLVGVLSLVVAFLCHFSIWDSPKDIGLSIGNEYKSKLKVEVQNVKWTQLFKRPFLLLITLANVVARCIEYTMNTWVQIYLIQDLKHSYYTAGAFNSSFELGGIVGSIFAGFISDIALTKSKFCCSTSNPRIPIVVGFYFVLVVSMTGFTYYTSSSSSYVFIVFISFLIGFAVYGPIVLLGVLAVEFAPSHLSGTSHSVMGLGGNVGKVLAGYPVTLLAKTYGWSVIFLSQTLAAVCLTVVLYTLKNVSPIKKPGTD